MSPSNICMLLLVTLLLVSFKCSLCYDNNIRTTSNRTYSPPVRAVNNITKNSPLPLTLSLLHPLLAKSTNGSAPDPARGTQHYDGDDVDLTPKNSLCTNGYSKDKRTVNRTNRFVDSLKNIPLDTSNVHPIVKSLCPKTISHYSQMPGYTNSMIVGLNYTVISNCLLKLVNDAFSKAGVTWLLWAGSSLGEYVHGGPIPWDDDVDIIVDIAFNSSVCSILHKYGNSSGALGCHTYSKQKRYGLRKVTKIFFLFGNHFTDSKVKASTSFMYPYIDTFYYVVNKAKNTFAESANEWKFPLDKILPPRLLFFGGYYLPFPRKNDMSLFKIRHYDINKCVIGAWDHYNERARNSTTHLDCCMLSKVFHFKQSICFDNGMKFDIISVNDRILYWVLYNKDGPNIVSYNHKHIEKYVPATSVANFVNCNS